MIAALSIFYRVSRNEKYLNAVVNTQKFIEENMCDGVQLFTSWRDGKHSEKSFLDDYAFYIASLIELYNSTLDKVYLERQNDSAMKRLDYLKIVNAMVFTSVKLVIQRFS